MTATERQLLREIRDLQARIVQLESRNARLRDTLRDERRRLGNRIVRLEALVKAHSTMHQQAVDQGRYWHGVALDHQHRKEYERENPAA